MADNPNTSSEYDNIPAEKQPNRMIVNAGQEIIKQHAPSHQAYYIESGRAEVTYRKGDHVMKVGEIGPGEVFGEMGLIEDDQRIATVTALEKCALIILSKKEFEERLEKIDDPIFASMINTLIKRLKDANESQMQHYRNLANFQDRMAGLMVEAGKGINQKKRDEFTNAISPLLDQVEDVLNKYRED